MMLTIGQSHNPSILQSLNRPHTVYFFA
jgi:hypothetical protein